MFFPSFFPSSSIPPSTQQASQLTDHNRLNVTNMSHLKSNCFNIVHTNIRSLSKNLPLLEVHLPLDNNIDIIVLTETWTSTNAILPPLTNFSVFHSPSPNTKKKNSNHGGIVTYYKSTLKIDSEILISNTLCQISFTYNSYLQLYILTIYRYPNSSIPLFLEILNSIIETALLNFTIQIFLLIGDININLNGISFSRDYTKLLYSYKFINGNTDNTRVTHHSSTLIDHIYYRKDTNCTTQTHSGNILTAITDHTLTYFSINSQKSPRIDSIKYHRQIFSQIKQNKFINSIKMTVLPNPTSNLNKDFYNFVEVVTNNFKKHFPLVPITHKKLTKPWMTPKIIIDIKRKQKLFKTFLKRPSLLNEFIYKEHRKNLRHRINFSKSQYFKSQFLNKGKTSKDKWRLLNSLLKQPIDSHKIELQTTDPLTANTAHCDTMNNYFASICTSNYTNIQYEYHNKIIDNSFSLKKQTLPKYLTFSLLVKHFGLP